MKKFEDELKSRTVAFGIDIMTKERTYSESKLIMCFEDWVSPEDYQKVGNNLKKTENNLFEALEENKQLKDQLKKQKTEIPEVPPFVANWLDSKPLYTINGSISAEIIEWSQKQTGYADLGMNISHLLKLKVNGYTVAKEKRFYLKNKLTGLNLVEEKTFSLTGKHVGERFREFEMQYIPTDEQEARLYKNTFTQQEIDSMAADSYEQIEVEE